MKKIGFVCSAALGVLLLSACSGSEGTTDAGSSGGDAGSSSGAAEISTLKPGLWEVTMTAANMPQPVVSRVCMGEPTPGTNSFAPPASGDCSKNEVTKTADGLELEMECTTSGVTTTSKGTITGDLTSNYKMEMVGKVSGANLPAAAQVEMKMTIAGKYLGDCPAGAKPGQVQK